MKNIKIEYFRGKGPGGQHKNKTSSCVRATHIPTGISVTIDGRNQHKNKRKALQELNKRLQEEQNNIKAEIKKEDRDYKIKNTKIIKTYNYKTQTVKDPRTGKTAPLKKVLNGHLELLQ